MGAIAIERTEWEDFLHAYETQHGGWLVTVENGQGASEAFEDHGAVLERLRLDKEHDAILLSLGWHGESQVLRIERPRTLELKTTNDSGDAGLDIEDGGGELHKLRFRQASPR